MTLAATKESSTCGQLVPPAPNSCHHFDSSTPIVGRLSSCSMTSIVKPPVTISVHSPALSPTSARSPRMASLLSALQAIIGLPSPHRAEFPATAVDNASPNTSHRSLHPHDSIQYAGRRRRTCADCLGRCLSRPHTRRTGHL